MSQKFDFPLKNIIPFCPPPPLKRYYIFSPPIPLPHRRRRRSMGRWESFNLECFKSFRDASASTADQCDQTLELKVAQFYTKVAQKEPKQIFTDNEWFLKLPKKLRNIWVYFVSCNGRCLQHFSKLAKSGHSYADDGDGNDAATFHLQT